jgi:hypothetical protein
MTRVSIPTDIAERTKDFVGRLWVLKEVTDWVDRGNERFLLVTGEPGSGKTALAAWLAGSGPRPWDKDANTNLEQVRDVWGAAHFCVRGQTGARFAQSLARQLSDRYDDYAEAIIQRTRPDMNIHQVARTNWGSMIGAQIGTLIVNSDTMDVYNRVVREPLETLVSRWPDLRVFILVDALDEALIYNPTNIITLLAGSDDLPTNVRFLLTSRNDSRVTDQFPKKRSLNLSSSKYDHDTDDDIGAYVQQRMAAIGSSVGVEDQLVKHAAGNFLYTKFLLDEVADGKRSLANLVGLPRGLYGLYREHLDRILPEMLQIDVNRLRWASEYQPLLGSLSVATPAAPRSVMPNWLGLPRGTVWPLLNDVDQVTEYDPKDGGGDRLYHRSMAEFLALAEYEEDSIPQRNRYFTPPEEQHERIVRYYVFNFQGHWQDCDPYGLRQLISHMQARLVLEQKPEERRKQAEELYTIVLDPQFQRAQYDRLGDIHTSLTDLRTVLEIALVCNDLVKVLACIGIYRDMMQSRSITQAIFEAVYKGNFERALQRVTTLQVSGRWMEILQFYLAWEAAEAGKTEVARGIITTAECLPLFGAEKLRDALLVRTVRTLAHKLTDGRSPLDLLSEYNRAQDAAMLLDKYKLAQPLDPIKQRDLSRELDENLAELERSVTEGSVDGISLLLFVTGNLRDVLIRLAATSDGKNGIDRALKSVVTSPYPQYRDISLIALGIASLAVPDAFWVRQRLQFILRTALDQEGVTFTFDLPTILLTESLKRNHLACELAEYLDQALSSNDRWGTVMRARSAHTVALVRQGQKAEAIRELVEAASLPRGFAGYAAVTALSLANRCYELEIPEHVPLPIWGQDRNITLLDLARQQAEQVADPLFREERIRLVEDYTTWWNQDSPDVETMQAALLGIANHDARMTYIDYVSARWATSISPNWEGLKALLPLTLLDSTTLDAVLGRLFGLSMHQLSDEDLTEAIDLCATHFTSGRPWKLGQWR